MDIHSYSRVLFTSGIHLSNTGEKNGASDPETCNSGISSRLFFVSQLLTIFFFFVLKSKNRCHSPFTFQIYVNSIAAFKQNALKTALASVN